jgi:hypothetical protein
MSLHHAPPDSIITQVSSEITSELNVQDVVEETLERKEQDEALGPGVSYLVHFETYGWRLGWRIDMCTKQAGNLLDVLVQVGALRAEHGDQATVHHTRNGYLLCIECLWPAWLPRDRPRPWELDVREEERILEEVSEDQWQRQGRWWRRRRGGAA